MSKTYNSKHDYIIKRGAVIYGDDIPEDYHGYSTHKRVKGNPYYEHDITHTTEKIFSNEHDVLMVRHPNKRSKRASLAKDFNTNGLHVRLDTKLRFEGDIDDRSSRKRLIKREMTQKRRQKMKNNAQIEIDRALNEE